MAESDLQVLELGVKPLLETGPGIALELLRQFGTHLEAFLSSIDFFPLLL